MGKLFSLACRTPWAYTVEGAGTVVGPTRIDGRPGQAPGPRQTPADQMIGFRRRQQAVARRDGAEEHWFAAAARPHRVVQGERRRRTNAVEERSTEALTERHAAAGVDGPRRADRYWKNA